VGIAVRHSRLECLLRCAVGGLAIGHPVSLHPLAAPGRTGTSAGLPQFGAR
jgi:hypothetical protein